MNEWRDYSGLGKSVLVIYPKVTEAVAKYHEERGLPPVNVSELKFGLDEVTQLVNLLGAELLSGENATIYNFLEKLNQEWDIIWLVTHGVPEGWFLYDGIVNPSETTAFIRAAATQLLVMNTCQSFEVANEIAGELGIALLCTIAEVPDRTAFIAGALFARQLASGLDYVEAWERSKPGQKHPYVLIEARRPMNPRDRGRSGSGQHLDPNDPNSMFRLVEEIDRVVFGSPRYGPGLRELVNLLRDENDKRKARLDAIDAKLTQMQTRQDERNKLTWGLIIAVSLLLLAVGFLIVRGGV